MMSIINKILNWYFSRESLPYWCLLLADTVIVFLSSILAYWIIEKTGNLFDNRFAVIYTSLLYAVLSLIGSRVFRTYSGVVRFSSFVDLLRVLYAFVFNVSLALIISLVFEHYGIKTICILSQTETLIAFTIAMMWMWGMRILVKTLYDVAVTDKRAKRVLARGLRDLSFVVLFLTTSVPSTWN